jgi:hypothetical protein
MISSLLGLTALFAGCSSTDGKSGTNPRHPGPALGQAAGTVVGTVSGNVAGAVVGVGEGTVNGIQQPFTNEPRVVRTWHTETTADGRTIQVPREILVDQYGRPVSTKP